MKKKLLICIFLLFSVLLFADNSTKNNIISIDALNFLISGNINLEYEHHFNKHISINTRLYFQDSNLSLFHYVLRDYINISYRAFISSLGINFRISSKEDLSGFHTGLWFGYGYYEMQEKDSAEWADRNSIISGCDIGYKWILFDSIALHLYTSIGLLKNFEIQGNLSYDNPFSLYYTILGLRFGFLF